MDLQIKDFVYFSVNIDQPLLHSLLSVRTVLCVWGVCVLYVFWEITPGQVRSVYLLRDLSPEERIETESRIPWFRYLTTKRITKERSGLPTLKGELNEFYFYYWRSVTLFSSNYREHLVFSFRQFPYCGRF